MNTEKYEEFVNLTCELLGFNKPIDVIKLCQLTSDFIRPYEMKIKELEKENSNLLQQIEKMQCCYNCEGYIDDDAYDLCKICKDYSKWALTE